MDLTNIHTNTVDYKGKRYELNLDFRAVLLYFQLISDEKLSIEERVSDAILLFCDKAADELNIQEKSELLKVIFDKKIFTERDRQRSELEPNAKKSFDFQQDADLIYSAFLQQYGQDITTEKLTWAQFTAELDSLSEDTFFKKVVGYRTMPMPPDAPDDASDQTKKQVRDYQDFISKMKLLYALDPLKKQGKLTDAEVNTIVKSLDMPHKMMKIKELKDAGRY